MHHNDIIREGGGLGKMTNDDRREKGSKNQEKVMTQYENSPRDRSDVTSALLRAGGAL